MLGSPDGLASTLGHRVAAVLRQRVLSTEPGYRPGQRLFAAQIAAELGVSITPVREALQLLATEHLVDQSPHRGVHVAHVDPLEFEDILRVLTGLQILAIRFRGGRLPPDEIVQLTECLDACEAAVNSHDLAAYRHYDHEFHDRIIVLSHSPKLVSLYHNLDQQAAILEIYFPHEPDVIGVSLAEHRDLVVQLAEGDPTKSELAMEEHGERSLARARRAYQKLPAASPEHDPPRSKDR